MGQAKTLDVRLRVIQMKHSKQTNSQISAVLGIGIGSVKNYWKRYLAEGEFGLSTHYSRCGRLVSLCKEKSYRLVRLVKHLHPSWGLPYVLIKIKEKYPDIELQSVRQYQRRLWKGIGKPPKGSIPTGVIEDHSRIAHDGWQVDAKEQLTLQDGSVGCYLTIVDEATGSFLAARAFPPESD